MFERDKGRNGQNEIGFRIHALCKQILGGMFDMIIRKCRHGIVTVIVIRLVANRQARNARLLGRFLEVLGQKLALLVEIVGSALLEEERKNNTLAVSSKEMFLFGIT